MLQASTVVCALLNLHYVLISRDEAGVLGDSYVQGWYATCAQAQ
jgi:hypothetical protein